MNIIYILTEGSYSDRTIRGAYSTKEKALEAQALLEDVDDSDIQSCYLDYTPAMPLGLSGWYVYIEKGVITSCMRAYPFSDKIPYEYFNKDIDSLKGNVNCWARDEEHAKKIALDKYYQYKAQLAGL